MDLESLKEIRITGLKVNYYYICKRKLWLFSKNLSLRKTMIKSFLVKYFMKIIINQKKRGIF
jgi:CRISPR-associated exonuclease, Cas4 family